MQCDECEKNGLKLIRLLLDSDQAKLQKLAEGLKKEIQYLKSKCYVEKGYFILECETRQKIVPIKEDPIVRYQCSNKHSWFLKKDN
jgi:hypothetical protein